MVDLEGAGRKRPPPAVQDTFERVQLVGLNREHVDLCKSDKTFTVHSKLTQATKRILKNSLINTFDFQEMQVGYDRNSI